MLASLLVLPALAALSAQAPAPWPRYGNGTGPLTFGADGSFQISIFEDLHFGENAWDSWGPQQDINSVKVMDAVLDRLRAGCWEADTWIRLETGAVVGAVTLNATYGRDWYPATPDDKTYCPTCNYTHKRLSRH